MKSYIFYRESDDFKDITQDTNLKKLFDFKIQYHQHLIIAGEDIPEDIQSYILLKYGDDLKNNNDIFIDRKPVPFVDYTPDPNRPKKFKEL
ncbi:MAG: hypothetical protein EB127_30650 [Alphaproteobacteria bacterium]|nr:hypothetical protein [Alphaproteobacteria bacterium]